MLLTSDEQIIMLYRVWSEESYAASFMGTGRGGNYYDLVKQFRGWLTAGWHQGEREDYETAMLEEYRKQEP